MDGVRAARIFDVLTRAGCAWMKLGRCGQAGVDWSGCFCWAKAQAVDAALPVESALPGILRAHDRRVTELL